MEQVDVLVLGAGFGGITAAKGYHQCDPEAKLLILDANQTVGGTWAKERLYDGLHSNNLLGTFEMPDLPFGERWGAKEGEHVPGMAIHQYLTEYATKFGVIDKIRFKTKALEAARLDDYGSGWRVLAEGPNGQYPIETKKLIVATGTTSTPKPLKVKGQELFNAPIVNTGHFSTEVTAVLNDPNIKRVVLVGGHKSAWDAAYMLANAGKQVDWIIRKSGHGPTWTPKSHVQTPFGELRLEFLATRRVVSWLSPCIWGSLDGSSRWRWLLHSTWLGRKIVEFYWNKVGYDGLAQSGILDHPRLAPLMPDSQFFDVASNVAILNFPTDFFQLVINEQITVYRQDLDRLEDHAVHLANGQVLRADAFVASPGWLCIPAVEFTERNLHSELGISSAHYSADQIAFWNSLDEQADKEIFQRFPTLKDRKYPPKATQDIKVNNVDQQDATQPTGPDDHFTPWRLYRHIAPPGLAARNDRSLAFANFSVSISGHVRNEIAAVWIYAWMNNKLNIDPYRDYSTDTETPYDPKNIYYHTALWSRVCYRRHSYGFWGGMPDVIFDAVPWNDVLLHDLGLSGQRKGGGFWNWREWFEPYTVADYRGVTDEWLEKHKSK